MPSCVARCRYKRGEAGSRCTRRTSAVLGQRQPPGTESHPDSSWLSRRLWLVAFGGLRLRFGGGIGHGHLLVVLRLDAHEYFHLSARRVEHDRLEDDAGQPAVLDSGANGACLFGVVEKLDEQRDEWAERL